MHINTDTYSLYMYILTHRDVKKHTHLIHMHMHQTSPVSPIYSPSILHLLRDFFPSPLTSLSPSVLPLSSRPPSPSLSEISEKIAEGQIRGWLPLCVTSKDKYSQDDSPCLEDVYVCTCCSTPPPKSPQHTLTHTLTHVCEHMCEFKHTHSAAFPLCSV